MIYISFAQAAVYEAVVAIEGGYQPYKLSLAPRPGASVDAAVAAAAHDVLVYYFPAQQAALDADYANALAAIPDGAAKDDGIALGQEAAAGIIALRQGDGLEADIGFTMPPPAPGVWQLPAGQTPQTPLVSKPRPFMLERPDQFRPGPPPELTSSKWAVEFNAVKTLGWSDSPYRTAEQTDVARFWSTNAIVQYNSAFKQIVEIRGLDAVQAARLFAIGNLIGADALIGCFDAKYHYLFWRPQFAIPQGDSDSNPETIGDPTWTPLLAIPNHPEYPAAHGCLTSAEVEVLAAFFGTNRINLDLTSAVPNLTHPTRHYDRVTDLVQEIVNARVWGGIHYRESVAKGVDLGRKVAQWTLKRYFLPES
jgi:PAP2 superfamily